MTETLRYEVVGSRGDWAEAADLDSAETAARTLVDDGNEWARVYDTAGRLLGGHDRNGAWTTASLARRREERSWTA